MCGELLEPITWVGKGGLRPLYDSHSLVRVKLFYALENKALAENLNDFIMSKLFMKIDRYADFK